MNIGIITQPLVSNYGGVLQNYALQKALIKIGHNPVTCDYIPVKSFFRVTLSLLLTLFLACTKKKRKFSSCFPIKRDKFVENFIKKYVNTTPPLSCYERNLIEDYQLRAFVVGSDQVWRPVYNDGVLLDNFLQFTNGYKLKRVAYSASFGVDKWEYSKKLTEQCALLAKNFDAISVREESAVALCAQYFNITATKVLDPTLLLTEEDYNEIVQLPQNLPEKYLLSYILDKSIEKENFISSNIDKMGFNRVDIGISGKLQYSIEEWLGLFKAADMVVTDSFHGTVFSIIFKKEFIVLPNNRRGLTRIVSLLDNIGLLDRLITDFTNMPALYSQIDWSSVSSKLQKQAEKDLSFLENSLS